MDTESTHLIAPDELWRITATAMGGLHVMDGPRRAPNISMLVQAENIAGDQIEVMYGMSPGEAVTFLKNMLATLAEIAPEHVRGLL